MADDDDQEGEPHPYDGQQQDRQQGQGHRFAPGRIEDRGRMAAQHRVRVRPRQCAREQRIGMGCEPPIGVQHQRPCQGQHHHQQAQHQGQTARHRGDGVVGMAQHPARQQERHRPRQARRRTGSTVPAQRHPRDAGHSRHEGSDRAHEAGHEDALPCIAAEQYLAPVQQLRIAAERPHRPQLRAPAVAHPIAARVAYQRTQGRARDGVRPRDFAQPDQHAHGEQQGKRGHDGAQDDHGVAEGDGEDHQPCGHGMRADPGQQVVEPGGFHRGIIGGAC